MNREIKFVPRRLGRKNKNGVKRIESDGYIHIFKPEHPFAMKNGYVREHRMIAYDFGLLKDASMEVHYKNGDRKDNRLENFEIITKEKHASLTWTGKKRKWTDEMRRAKSIQMKGNQNLKGKL